MKFNLCCVVGVSAYTVVEADTEAEAIAIAKARQVVMGGTGSGAQPDESWVIEDADGEPDGICCDK